MIYILRTLFLFDEQNTKQQQQQKRFANIVTILCRHNKNTKKNTHIRDEASDQSAYTVYTEYVL